jgi:hypothetical protein
MNLCVHVSTQKNVQTGRLPNSRNLVLVCATEKRKFVFARALFVGRVVLSQKQA